MEAFINGRHTGTLGKRSSPLIFDLCLVQCVLVLVHVLRQVLADVFCTNLTHMGGVSVPGDYEKMVGAAPPTLNHPSSDERSELSG